jgi:hypothetical protein
MPEENGSLSGRAADRADAARHETPGIGVSERARQAYTLRNRRVVLSTNLAIEILKGEMKLRTIP